jgi:redox-sensitive bicupin YhaK (pirin superfamily)
MGLQTVTWLVSGELVHHDSLGSEQPIRPGQLNLMTAGRGVAHSEEAPDSARGEYHGIQLWVAQPEATRHGEPEFEHLLDLPTTEVANGTATVLIGSFGSATSPARRDTEHLGVELNLRRGATSLPLRVEHEHALVVLTGALDVGGRPVGPGQLAYLGIGRDELFANASASTKAILLGGVPFNEPLLMWWNFVGRQRDELADAFRHWSEDDGWFGHVRSRLDRIPVARPPWLRGG